MNSFEQAFDDRAESFLQVGSVARKVAQIHCGVEIDDTTDHRWQQLMGLLREVDTLADDKHVPTSDILAELEDFSLFKARYPDLTPDALGRDPQERLLRRTGRIFKLSDELARTTNISRFVALRIVEGRETANFLEDAASNVVKDQDNFSHDFMPTIRSMAVTANLIDSITDARADYADGKLAFKPSREYYGALLNSIPWNSALGSRAIMHMPVLGEFATMSWNRLVNRVKHRDSSTTSLRVFRQEK